MKPLTTADISLEATALRAGGRIRPVLFLCLSLAGIGLWWRYGGAVHFEPARLVALLVLALLYAVPSSRQALLAAMDWLNHATPRRQALVFGAVVLIGGFYLYRVALHHASDMNAASIQDEFVYLIQTQMVARGRLWMPALPLGDFFHSYFLFVTPAYAAKYTPGNALIQAPMVWFHLPLWVMPLLVASLCLGAVYLLFAQLLDGVSGVLGALLLLGAREFRASSALVMPYLPAVLFILLTLWAGVLWHKSRRLGWAAAVGFFSSFALIIRPGESLCFILPLGIAMAADLFHRRSLRHAAATIGLIALAAAPLLAIQVVSNIGITGRWNELPYDYHLKLYHPAHRLGFHQYHPRPRLLEQMEEADAQWAGDLRSHTPGNMPHIWIAARFPVMRTSLICDGLLLLLLPLGLMGLRGKFGRYRLAIACALPLFILLYTFYPFFLRSYPMPVIPAVLLLIVLGTGACVRILPARRWLAALPPLLVATIALTSLPQLDNKNWGFYFIADELRHIDAVLEKQVHPPAVVLFRYRSHTGAHPDQEPVYNTNVAWPDDAPIIRAHDLGRRNGEIYRYYAKIAPNRRFYRYDRGTGMLTGLGTAAQLAAHPPENSGD